MKLQTINNKNKRKGDPKKERGSSIDKWLITNCGRPKMKFKHRRKDCIEAEGEAKLQRKAEVVFMILQLQS